MRTPQSSANGTQLADLDLHRRGYNQSSSDSTTDGARVAFYALTVAHS